MSKIGTLTCPYFRQSLYSHAPKTGHNYVRFLNIQLSDVRFIHLCPVIGRLLYLKRLKTGHKHPVFRRFRPVSNV